MGVYNTLSQREMESDEKIISIVSADIGLESRNVGEYVCVIPAGIVEELYSNQLPSQIDNSFLLNQDKHKINESLY